MKTIGLACDHAGFELKEYVRGWLEVKGWAYKDFGTNSAASVQETTKSLDSRQSYITGKAICSIVLCGLPDRCDSSQQ